MILEFTGKLLAGFLTKPISGYAPPSTSSLKMLKACLKPGDVLLVEGNQRVSAVIKYLTQSTWSHAALYLGDQGRSRGEDGAILNLMEAELETGVILVPLTKYSNYHTRICRPVGLSEEDRQRVLEFALGALGKTYDLKNIIDLLRYFLPPPPVPLKWRRKLLALGSGEPTKAICSTLIAQAFQSVQYPILPNEVHGEIEGGTTLKYKIRHHSLFTPRDFDISPYFQIVKPTIESGFNYRSFSWAEKL